MFAQAKPLKVNNQTKVYEIALSLISGIGPVKAKLLVSYLGSAEAIFNAKPTDLKQIPGVGSTFLKQSNLSDCLKRAEREWQFMEKNGVECLYYQEDTYPKWLKQAEDSPVVIFTKGAMDFNRKNVAVVGTRKATAYGKKLTHDFVKDLSDLDVNIVSGLAFGIDVEAHKAALTYGLPTIGVFPRGLDYIYPATHKHIAMEMLEKGGWVSEFLSETPGDASNFPKRNRIVAGMCESTVVIESAEKGGSLITAGLANDYNRDVFAFPGNVDKHSSKGCNYLIQKNRAHLITSAQDMLDVLGWNQPKNESSFQTDMFVELNDEEQAIVNYIKLNGNTHIDTLIHQMSMSVSVMSVHLFNLEIKGVIRALAGKHYEAI